MKFENKSQKSPILSLISQFFVPSYLKTKESKFRTFTEITWILFGAFLAFIGIQFFIKDIFFNSGLTGIALIVSQIIHNTSPNITKIVPLIILYVLLIIMNIPFFIFGWIKLSKRITIYGIIFILAISIFGLTLGTYFQENDPTWIFKTISIIRILILNNRSIENIYTESIFIAVMGAVIFATGVYLSYRSRGCSGGTDFPIIYYSSKKHHGIGHYTIIINIIVLFIGIISLYWTDPLKTKEGYTFLQYATSYKIIGSVLYLVIYGIVIDILFPRSKKLSVFIITTKAKEIISACKKDKFIHTFTSIDVTGMYRNTNNKCLISVMNYYDYIYVLGAVKKNDPKAFIFSHKTKAVFGNFSSKVDLY